MNPVEIRKEKEREDLYLLYIQAVSIENLLQLKDASTWNTEFYRLCNYEVSANNRSFCSIFFYL